MKYFSIKSVMTAFKSIENKTLDGFWGIMAILRSLDVNIEPCYVYKLNPNKISEILERWFSISENYKKYSSNSEWYAIFSKEWYIQIQLFLKQKPNIYDIICWMYQHHSFEKIPSLIELKTMFSKGSSISEDIIDELFDVSPRSYFEFDDYHFSQKEKIESMISYYGVFVDSKSINCRGKYLAAEAGAFQRAPFIQTLYASNETFKCLMINNVSPSYYYPSIFKDKPNSNMSHCLQQIFFGAPGTGKSFQINQICDVHENYRTTFHPDSDYSTFVGCYKPTKKQRSKEILLPLNELVELSKGETTTELRVKFISRYAESIKTAALNNELSVNQIIRDENYFGWNSDTYMMNFLNEILAERAKADDSEITYDFTPQAFTNAYVAAWKNLDAPFFLIIEEINRGNCAQIFGDIFQLLDRNQDGYSSYKITPDQDLANYLRAQFADTDIADDGIKSGREMLLPPNLHIWATMNTSDQSLFPIDSAFKRRWDWRYIPIDYTDQGHYIACGDKKYSWADFLLKINERVEAVTQSEDKKLGYWFMGNGKDQKEIGIERFVSKVVFYLWNDVFKDYGNSGNTIFKGDYSKFHKFFDYSGNPKAEVVSAFLDSIEVSNEIIDPNETGNDNGIDYTKYSFDNNDRVSKKDLGRLIVEKYLDAQGNMNYSDIIAAVAFDSSVDSKYTYRGIIAREDDITGCYVSCYTPTARISADGVKYKILIWWNKFNIDYIIKFAQAQGWNVEISEQ